MTQQLQQSIKLLQCTSLELRAFVELELEKNPFLAGEEARRRKRPKKQTNPADDGEPREADFGDNQNFESDMGGSGDSWGDDSAEIETDYLSAMTRHQHRRIRPAFEADDDTRGIEDNPSQGVSMREHLVEQLHLDITDPVQRMIGANLIDMTDEAGYIKDDLKPVAEAFGAEKSEVEAVLA